MGKVSRELVMHMTLLQTHQAGSREESSIYRHQYPCFLMMSEGHGPCWDVFRLVCCSPLYLLEKLLLARWVHCSVLRWMSNGLHFSSLPWIARAMDKAAGNGMAQLVMMWHGMHSSKARDLVSAQVHAGRMHRPRRNYFFRCLGHSSAGTSSCDDRVFSSSGISTCTEVRSISILKPAELS